MYNTCTIKNIDSANQSVLGVILAPNDVYEIPATKRVKASEDSSILTRIAESKLQIGNGTSFYPTIASQINYLRSGISNVSISDAQVDLEVKNSVKGFKLNRSSVNTALSTSYASILNIDGSGTFMGFKAIFSNEDVNIKLSIDGSICFEMPVSELRDMNYEDWTNSGVNRFFGGSQYGEFEFFPPGGLGYTSNLKIEMKKNVNWTINKTFHHILYSEDL